MRRVSACALLVVLSMAVAAPAGAGTMLYATAATPGRIHGFCVRDDGALAPTPRVDVATRGSYPSRLRVSAATRTLYVAENDRVEVFRIGPDGSLSRPQPDHVPVPARGGVNARDIALDCRPDDLGCRPSVLYVPERRFQRLSAFPLDPESGIPLATAASSCVSGDLGVGFEQLLYNDRVSPRLLYASQETGDQGAVVGYALDARGQLVGECLADDPASGDDPDDCNRGEDPREHPEDLDGVCDDDPASGEDDDGVLAPCVGRVACGLAPLDDPPPCPARGAPLDCPAGSVPCPEEAGGPCLCCRPSGRGTPGSTRRVRLPGAGALVLADNPEGIVSACNPAPSSLRLYVAARFSRTVLAFNLDAAGHFDVRRRRLRAGDPRSCAPVTRRDGSPVYRQRPASKTTAGIRHQDLVVAGTPPRITILASQFVEGRIDAYRLRESSALPGAPSAATRKDVRTSPVRLLVHELPPLAGNRARRVLYVAAGQHDRIQAFRLRANGLPASLRPFSETAPIPGSFPNDIALVDVEEGCGP